jgi:NTE family protein
MVWPAVRIGESHYIDGGVRSSANADLARGVDRVIVLAPFPQALTRVTSIPGQLATTGATHTAVVAPDREALADIGRNVLDPGKRADAARTGRRQAAQEVAKVRRAWG